MNTQEMEIYDAIPLCEECGKPFTGLNAYEFVTFLKGDIDDPLCDACVKKGKEQGE